MDTALHYAAAAGNAIMQMLLGASDLDVNAADHFGATALHHAVLRGQAANVQLLLGAPGLDVNELSMDSRLWTWRDGQAMPPSCRFWRV